MRLEETVAYLFLMWAWQFCSRKAVDRLRVARSRVVAYGCGLQRIKVARGRLKIVVHRKKTFNISPEWSMASLIDLQRNSLKIVMARGKLMTQ